MLLTMVISSYIQFSENDITSFMAEYNFIVSIYHMLFLSNGSLMII